MRKHPPTLEELVKVLPPHRQSEVRDFVEFLLTKEQNGARGNPAFKWEGALKDLGTQYTSVELQHLIARWRAEGK